MRNWDPHLKVPEPADPAPSTQTSGAPSSSSAEQWLAAADQTPAGWLQNGIDVPVPEGPDDNMDDNHDNTTEAPNPQEENMEDMPTQAEDMEDKPTQDKNMEDMP